MDMGTLDDKGHAVGATYDQLRRENDYLKRRVAWYEAHIEELARLQPPAPVYLEVPAELREALVAHLRSMGVKG